MLYVETKSLNPRINLAYEEYFLNNQYCKESVCLLWQNNPTIVVGRFQNTFEEINSDYVTKKEINVVRRITGGGAVYHDLGNLCYSFIFRNVNSSSVSFSFFGDSVVKTLDKIGIRAELSGRNDLTIDGKKFSGTAMALHKDSLLFHGTILFDSDLEAVSNSLNVSKEKFNSKAAKSVASRVTNIKQYLKSDVDLIEFKDLLKNAVFENEPYEKYDLTRRDMAKIQWLKTNKYDRWEWNYGKSPDAEYHNRKRFKGGTFECFLKLSDGKIENCCIYGDFMGLQDLKVIQNSLKGVNYTEHDVLGILNKFDIQKYFGSISKDEIISCMFNR